LFCACSDLVLWAEDQTPSRSSSDARSLRRAQERGTCTNLLWGKLALYAGEVRHGDGAVVIMTVKCRHRRKIAEAGAFLVENEEKAITGITMLCCEKKHNLVACIAICRGNSQEIVEIMNLEDCVDFSEQELTSVRWFRR